MSVRATWTTPRGLAYEVTDDFSDQYGSTLDEGNVGLVLDQDGDCLVIEGAPDDLMELLVRLWSEVERYSTTTDESPVTYDAGAMG